MNPALLLSAFLQAGTLQGGAVIYEPPKQLLVQDLPCYATLGVEASYGILFAETEVRTDMKPVSWNDWWPYQTTYTIGGGIEYKGITLGIKHTCYHPVTPYIVWGGYAVVPKFEGATNNLYIRLEIGRKR